MKVAATALIAALAVLVPPGPAASVEVPDEGDCPPYPLRSRDGEDVVAEDIVPPLFRPGELIPIDGLGRLRDYLPPEVWDRRDTFFYEGMLLEVGPCHRRYPNPEFFDAATAANAATARVDDAGNLTGFSGTGLPFRWQDIQDDEKPAGWKWAWNYRYRYQGSGYRGDFRVTHVAPRARNSEKFTGNFYLLPMHGVPGIATRTSHDRFWAGGAFRTPPISRGIAWRQAHPTEADTKPNRSDEIWVWLPEARRARRAAPTAVDGLYMPSHERGSTADWGRVVVPGGQFGESIALETPDPSIAATEHTRRGFTGLMLRPNAYYFGYTRTRDVLAPINSNRYGYPADNERSYGPSGLSVGTDRWEIRRAVVLKGVRKTIEGQVASVTLYIDALTQQPLYMITRRANGHINEVGIMVGRFSADDPLHPKWKGSGAEFGVILPIAATFFVAGEGGWIRESFELRSDPPSDRERSSLTSTIELQRGR